MLERYQQAAHKLGSEVTITIIAEDNPIKVFEVFWKAIDDFEDRFSRFRPYSELSRLNMNPGVKFEASTELIDIVKVSNTFYKKTNGYYNPLILPDLQRAGYLSSWPEPSSISLDQLNYTKRHTKNSSGLVDEEFIMIPAESALDLGGIGKGYLLDKLYILLTQLEVLNFLVSLGGDIICSGSDIEGGQGWSVDIGSAQKEGRPAGKSLLAGDSKYKAVASSGVTKRKGPGWHHIINPKTGLPSKSDILIASVISTEGVTSDILAKVLLIGGSANAQTIAKQFNIGYFLQTVQNKNIKHNWT